jgi:hypothetical protein
MPNHFWSFHEQRFFGWYCVIDLFMVLVHIDLNAQQTSPAMIVEMCNKQLLQARL